LNIIKSVSFRLTLLADNGMDAAAGNSNGRNKQRRGTILDIISPQLIKKVTGEYDLEIVQWLSLSGNGIRCIENLLSCSNLLELDLSHNQIRQIEGLDALAKLQKLNLASNRIQRLENLDHLEALEQLELQGNQITCVDDVSSLQHLARLKHFYLKNYDGSKSNPACDHPSYSTIVLRYLTKLTVLDGESTHLQKYMGDWEKLLESLQPDECKTPPIERWCDGIDLNDDIDEDVFADNGGPFAAGARGLQELLLDVDDLLEDASNLVSESKRDMKKLLSKT